MARLNPDPDDVVDLFRYITRIGPSPNEVIILGLTALAVLKPIADVAATLLRASTPEEEST